MVSRPAFNRRWLTRGGPTRTSHPGLAQAEAASAVPRRAALLTSSKNTIPLLKKCWASCEINRGQDIKGLARGAGEPSLQEGTLLGQPKAFPKFFCSSRPRARPWIGASGWGCSRREPGERCKHKWGPPGDRFCCRLPQALFIP